MRWIAFANLDALHAAAEQKVGDADLPPSPFGKYDMGEIEVDRAASDVENTYSEIFLRNLRDTTEALHVERKHHPHFGAVSKIHKQGDRYADWAGDGTNEAEDLVGGYSGFRCWTCHVHASDVCVR